MRTITYEAAEVQEETVSAFLMMFLEYATEIGAFGLLERLVKVKMKAVWYSVLHKAQTMMASLVMGCEHTKAINDVLGEERAAAAYLGMPRFPDQSQINRYLTRLDAENVAQLGEVHAQLFEAHSQARRAVGRVVVDIDQCGLVVNGKTYEWAHKGYFPRKRGEIGYQLSAAYIGAYQEALQVYLDPGNSHCKSRLSDLLADIERLLLTDNPQIQVIRRLDAGYDSADNRQMLASLPGGFILKGADSKLAKRLAQQVRLQDWLPVAEGVHGTEIQPQAGIRCLLYEFYLSDGQFAYALLHTNLPQAEFGVCRAFAFYNERTTVEAFFAASRHVFNIQSMRSRKFNAIYAFLRFVFLTHNLIHWAKCSRLADSEFEQASTRELVDKFTRVRAYVSWQGHWRVSIIATSRWATALLNVLSRPPSPIQLAFPFARLHKT
jgi:hypothetical protein